MFMEKLIDKLTIPATELFHHSNTKSKEVKK